MKLKKPTRKSIAWYKQELRDIAMRANEAIERGSRTQAVEDAIERACDYGCTLVAISVVAEAAADGVEMYLEGADAGS